MAGRALATGLASWRRLMEQEQLAALRQVDEVGPKPAMCEVGCDTTCINPGATQTIADRQMWLTASPIMRGQIRQNHAGWAPLPTAAAPPSPETSLPGGGDTHAAPTLALPPFMALPCGVPAVASALAARAQGVHEANFLPAPALPSTLAARPAAVLHAMQHAGLSPWPWRQLHFTLAEGGVHGWLRDRDIAPGSRVLAQGLGHLRGVLAHAGLALVGFTLNGHAIALE